MSQDRYTEAFWAKVGKAGSEDCWPWTGYTKPSGHGLTSHLSLPIHAHRKAWILTHGPIRDSRVVNHKCDNPRCCNPAHLYLGTRGDNMIDRWGKIPPEDRKMYGRPFVLDDTQLERLWQRRRENATLKECAQEFGVHISTICRYLTEVRRRKVERLRSARLSASQN